MRQSFVRLSALILNVMMLFAVSVSLCQGALIIRTITSADLPFVFTLTEQITNGMETDEDALRIQIQNAIWDIPGSPLPFALQESLYEPSADPTTNARNRMQCQLAVANCSDVLQFVNSGANFDMAPAILRVVSDLNGSINTGFLGSLPNFFASGLDAEPTFSTFAPLVLNPGTPNATFMQVLITFSSDANPSVNGQDSDTIRIPEPPSLALFGIALLVFALGYGKVRNPLSI